MVLIESDTLLHARIPLSPPDFPAALSLSLSCQLEQPLRLVHGPHATPGGGKPCCFLLTIETCHRCSVRRRRVGPGRNRSRRQDPCCETNYLDSTPPSIHDISVEIFSRNVVQCTNPSYIPAPQALAPQALIVLVYQRSNAEPYPA